MKFLGSQLGYFLQSKNTRRNIRLLLKYLTALAAMVTLYSVLFHYIMASEGRDHSWITGFYWTLTVMSTLGFGDITFSSDGGRIFSLLVLLSGVVFLLVLLPFTFIQFFYAPWIEAERKSRTPRELPPRTRGHVIISGYNSVTETLISKLRSHRMEYVLIEGDLHSAVDLYDAGVRTAVGNVDDPETYRLMAASGAALVVAANSDEVNTNIAFTVREINDLVPVICTADSPASVDILTMAGATLVIQLADMLGASLARRTIGGETRANVIARFDGLLVAEAPVMGTPLVGKNIARSGLREKIGINIVGLWERGVFRVPSPDTVLSPTTVMVIAGSQEQLHRYDELMFIYQISTEPVIIIGGGRVGQSVARSFAERNIPYLIVEKNREYAIRHATHIHGDAADLDTLVGAGIRTAPAVILTTHDDATNIYLAKYCRSLRPDIQIISRASLDRNVSTLHRAGVDFVMSYATLGADMMFNFLQKEDIVMQAEGLDIFRSPVPPGLAGKSLAQAKIRQETGCTVIAVKQEGGTSVNPDPHAVLSRGGEMILIGSGESERRFFRRYSD